MTDDGSGPSSEKDHVERLTSALEEAYAELDELRVKTFRLERENLRLQISLQLLHEDVASDDALDALIALREREPSSIRLEG